ncbi:MAG: beta strand repeat-containing protein [Candidatus Altimarinota bacterium]
MGGYTGSLEQPTNGATASTTTISNSSATGSVSSYNRYVGGWAGYTYVGLSGSKITLSNVSASGSVTVGTRNSITPHYIGGLIGFAQAYDGGGAFTAPLGYEWSAVSATGNVTVDSGALGGNYVGGLVGYVQSGRTAGGGATSTLSRLSATGTVSVTSSSANFNYVGGLIGRAYAATGATLNLNSTGGQTYATGNVSTDGIYVGGLIGYANTTTNASMTLNDVYSNGTVSGRQYVGGAIGYVSNGTTATMTISDIQSHDSNSATTANTVTATTLNAVGGLFGGADSTGTSFNLSNCDSIASVTGVTGYAGGLIGYDRRNLTISNCSASGNVTSGGQYVGGLTGGSTDTGRAYSDVTASGNVTASVSGATNNIYVGGLSGYMRGTLTRGKAHGDVTIQVNTGATINQAIVGGLIGQANGLPVDQSFARGTVTFTDLTVGNLTYVGGLIGVTNSAVTNSFALGDVSGGQQVGGLLGNSSSTVASSFAAGNVSGQRYVGGLVGNFTLNSAGAVNLTYALGSINRINSASTDYFGQLIGYCNAGLGDTKVTNSYYLDQALPVTGQTVCNSATAARAQSDTAMKTADGTGVVFNGWDFSGTNTNSWRYPTSFSKKGQSVYLYPILYWALP